MVRPSCHLIGSPSSACLFIGFLFSALSLPAQIPQPECSPKVVGHLETLKLSSRVFHNYRNLRVWLPPGYDDPTNATKKYPVLYLLDGASVFDACTAYLHETLGADRTLTDLISAGKIAPLIAVGIENGSDAAGPLDTGQQREREFLPYPDPTEPEIGPNCGEILGRSVSRVSGRRCHASGERALPRPRQQSSRCRPAAHRITHDCRRRPSQHG